MLFRRTAAEEQRIDQSEGTLAFNQSPHVLCQISPPNSEYSHPNSNDFVQLNTCIVQPISTGENSMSRIVPRKAFGSPSAEMDLASETRRKRIRKGTTSCWECKRRKSRCIFTPTDPAGGICDGCRRRGTACISQEFPDAPSSLTNKRTDDRLGRVEALVEQLIQGSTEVHGKNDLHTPGGLQRQGNPSLRNELPSPMDNCTGPAITIPTPTAPTPRIETPDQNPRPLPGKYDQVSRALLQAWPSPDDLDQLINSHDPAGISGLFRKVASYTCDFPHEHIPSMAPLDVLMLPPSESHPVQIAHKLLLLAIFLQYSSLRFDLSPTSRIPTAEVRQTIMSRVRHATTTLVTNNDELIGSVEGIECLMLEGLYQDTAGNVRRSWVATRRAMGVAQMMGLHRGRAKFLDAASRSRFNPQYMWFRLVQSDRYLSLMLGLPQGCSDDVFATPKALQACEPIERLRRIDTMASGRIIQRNDAGNEGDNANHLATTFEIDKLLQKALDTMPSRWWLLDGAVTSDSQGRCMLSDTDTRRLMDQIAHYNLVIHLHLPYLLQSSSDHRYNYSKMTIVSASREVLTRFATFRRVYPVGSYCRGIDFLAFIATAALCLAHLEGRRLHNSSLLNTVDQGATSYSDDQSKDNILNFLAHQRPTDRALMECATESLEYMATSNLDNLASRLATVLRHLLVIEADAAKNMDSYYSTEMSPEDGLQDACRGEHGDEDEASGCNGKLSRGGSVLHIYIPYYGTVRIERRRGVTMSDISTAAAPRSPGAPQTVSAGFDRRQPPTDVFILDGDDSGQYFPVFDPELAAETDDWALQGVDMAFFDGLVRGLAEDGLET